MKNIIVTGATSMIGIALIKAAINDCDIQNIYAIARPDSKKLQRLPLNSKITVVECDVKDYRKLPTLISEDIDVFFHLAWPRTATYEETFEDTYEKTQNILYVLDALRASKSLGCKTFVGTGSQSEYGIVKNGMISINTPCNPVRNDGIIHLTAGRLVGITASQLEMTSAWIRVFSVYGPNDRDNSLVKSTIKRMKRGERCSFTECTQLWDYLYEDDAGKAFLEVGKTVEGNKVYNLGYGDAKQLKDYILCIRDIINPNEKIYFGELPYPPNPIMNLQCDISLLHKDTGWKPLIPFDEGIRRMVMEMDYV